MGFVRFNLNSHHPAEWLGPASAAARRLTHMPPIGGGQALPFGAAVWERVFQ